jgi:hypothetical protein
MALTEFVVSNYHTALCKGALVDRGANGGIAGEDVRVIAKTSCQVDIQGIDNHRIVARPIITAGAVINTQKGEVIAIMNQYAYIGKGKSTHSCEKLEDYKKVVHDKLANSVRSCHAEQDLWLCKNGEHYAYTAVHVDTLILVMKNLSFHCVREAIESKFIVFHFLLGASNHADVLSKHWAYFATCKLVQCLFY